MCLCCDNIDVQFFAIFQLNQIIGNLLVALILDRLSLSRTYLFMILTVVGCFSVVSFLFLKYFFCSFASFGDYVWRSLSLLHSRFFRNPTAASQQIEAKNLTTCQRIAETIKVFTEARMILFTTIIIFSGLR
jgi:hypothetical protein